MTKEAKMFRVVEAWHGSGMSKERYAVKSGLSRSTFQYWTKRYAQSRAGSLAPEFAPLAPAFVQMPVVSTETLQETLTKIVITLPSGTRIEVS